MQRDEIIPEKGTNEKFAFTLKDFLQAPTRISGQHLVRTTYIQMEEDNFHFAKWKCHIWGFLEHM